MYGNPILREEKGLIESVYPNDGGRWEARGAGNGGVW